MQTRNRLKSNLFTQSGEIMSFLFCLGYVDDQYPYESNYFVREGTADP